jgi:hypothetical protein
MQQERQEDRKQAEELHDFNSLPARDFKRWAVMHEALIKLAFTSKLELYKQATDFLNASPGAIAEPEPLMQKLLETVGSSDPLVEAEAYLLVKGLQNVPFEEISTSTNQTYLHYMGLVLEAGELAAQRLQAAMDDYQSRRLSEPGQGRTEPEAANLSDQQSIKAVGVPTLKEKS